MGWSGGIRVYVFLSDCLSRLPTLRDYTIAGRAWQHGRCQGVRFNFGAIEAEQAS